MDDREMENLKVTGAKSPQFWIGVYILFTGLAGIISPSLIAISFSVLSAIGLYTWALYFSIQGPVMKGVVFAALIVSALYINISFIIQIEFFEKIQNDWMDYVGLDNFDSDNPRFKEHLSGYVITVCVYIICLIYSKSSFRKEQKEKYLSSKKPHILRKAEAASRKRQISDDASLLQTLGYQLYMIVKNPQLHLMLLRFCLFIWIYLYFCFQSIVPLFFFFHSIIYMALPTLLG